jgi:hypothetical protein
MMLAALAVMLGLGLVIPAQISPVPAELSGRILFSGLPVPGATVTATHGDRAATTVSGADGAFRIAGLRSGVWMLRVEMRGFVTVTRQTTLPAAEPLTVALVMKPYRDIMGLLTSPARVEPAAPPLLEDTDVAHADVINGSVINGASTPFGLPRAFGNNRPGSGPRYTGGISAVFGNSAWNAAPFSFAESATPVPSYGDAQFEITLAGPLRLPGLLKNGPQMRLAYEHGALHNAATQSAVMPGAAERAGDFANSPVAVRDPATGLPFLGGVVPEGRISPSARALLAYYPLPNAADTLGANYQLPILSATTEDKFQFGTSMAITRHTTLNGTVAFQRTDTETNTLFGFTDTARRSSVTATAGWTYRLTAHASARLRYQFTRAVTAVTPFFANRVDVSGEAGISGNSPNPADWGPPALSFPDVAGLRDADFQHSRSRSHAAGGELLFKRGRHNVTAGGDIRWNDIGVTSQANPRGTLGFTGTATGVAFADFLLGLPATSSIAFRNRGTRLQDVTSDAYVADDWHLNGLTLNLGVRWEYEGPFADRTGSTPGGLQPDRRGVEPRMGVSWRPVSASSLVVRGSYGVYRNPGLYQSLALLLVQQPPYARTFSVQNTLATPLTLADPFPSSIPSTMTFTVDPHVRVGYAQNWQVSIQHDLRGSLTTTAAYLGARGGDLTQAVLPNTYPPGGTNPCPACLSGFVAVSSGGTSSRNALQLTLRRRLQGGLTASAQYTLAKSTDDAATFSNSAVGPAALAIAQDWLNPQAERGPSSFDQRHLLTATAQYTSGVGVRGGTLVDGAWATLFKDWTLTAQLSMGSGLPFTPVYFAAVPGTGVVGIRPRLSGGVAEPPPGAYANAATYAAPVAGTWGDAGRNSLRGPEQFTMDARVARVLRLGGRLNLECGVAATNVLNRVTFSTIETVISSPQFGRPTLANPMRRIRATLRLRF